MNYQDFRNLQEAYMEVVMNELDEGYKELPVDKMVAKSKSLARIPREPGSPRWDRNAQRGSDIRKTAGTHSRAKVKKVEKANRERGTQKEQVDLYDVILSHLLDEGYADTQEAAEAIMVNMSEEWRDDISELYKGKHGQSETEYQAGRSDAGKRVSGDENTGPRHYALGRSARPDAPTKPGEKPKNTPKLANWEKDDIQYRKANLKK